MKNKNLFFVLVAVLFVLQVASSSYLIYQNNLLQDSLSETNSLMNSNFDLVNGEISSINSEIDSLVVSVFETRESLTETQESFEDQISEIKAGTSADFSGIIEGSVEAVVSIKTDVAQGSGFAVTSDGYVVTNAHVLEGASYAKAISANQREFSMSLVGYSSTLDLALLKVGGENWEYLEFADSDDVRVGEKVIAIGNPYGLSFSVSEGIISAVGRKINGYGGDYIQTDTAINSGNSGGPLINTGGEVVGVNNLKIEGDNIGFALESNYVAEEVNVIAMEKLGYEII